MTRPSASPRLSALRGLRDLRWAVALLCMLLASAGAIESHNLGNHHRELEVGGLFETAASHPGSAHHYERSEELREPACATCALQTHARGVRPVAGSAAAPTESHGIETSAAVLPAPAVLTSSASPRGPPTA